MVLSDSVTSSDLHFGIITGSTTLSSSAATKYTVKGLVDGQTFDSLATDLEKGTGANNYTEKVLYEFKYNAAGELNEVKSVNDSDNAVLLGTIAADGDKIEIKNGAVEIADDTYITIASDAVYYDDDKIGTQTDLINADAGRTIYLIDTGKADDRDKVADVIVIAKNANGTSYGSSDADEKSVKAGTASVSQYDGYGIKGVNEANLDAVNKAVKDNTTSITDKASVQNVVDAYLAVEYAKAHVSSFYATTADITAMENNNTIAVDTTKTLSKSDIGAANDVTVTVTWALNTGATADASGSFTSSTYTANSNAGKTGTLTATFAVGTLSLSNNTADVEVANKATV
jgi:hypothetical protein